MAAARKEFARAGYASAATERIVESAGVTRGALYHHYRDKRELFDAVVQELQRTIAAAIDRRAACEKNVFEGLLAGCDAWLDACLDPEVQRILLLDGPAVLGWQRWNEIDAAHGTGSLRAGIDACIAAGHFTGELARGAYRVDAEALTHVLAGAMNQVALALAQSKDATRLRKAAGRTLRSLLHGLRSEARRAPGGRRPNSRAPTRRR